MYLSITEAAKQVGISRHELRVGALQGRYPFILCGRNRRFDPDAVLAVLQDQAVMNQKAAIMSAQLEDGLSDAGR